MAAAVVVLVAVGAVLGVVSGTFAALAGPSPRSGPSSFPARPVPGSASASPTPTPSPAADLPRSVLEVAESDGAPRTSAVTARIEGVKVKDAKGSYSAAVLDVGSGKLVYSHDAERAAIPASTMKLLTGAAALSLLGPQHTFATSVVSSEAGRIVLVGGGDPYLAGRTDTTQVPQRASVTELARATALRLRAAKVRAVDLGYDTSLFSGPAWNKRWPDAYSDQVTPTSALWVDEGRVRGASPGPRYRDPAKQAATAFAVALRKEKIAVRAVAPGRAPAGAATLAAVSSMPLERIVEQMLMVSDNDAAEVLFRQVALAAGKAGSSSAAAAALRAELTRLGVWAPGTVVYDGSGLARQTRVSSATMVALLRLAAGEDHPTLRPVIVGLPVAGVEGSLRSRYFDDESLAGRGVVRGKTGTLRKVHTLAGFVRTRDGSLLVYAFLINNPKSDYAARVWLDRVTSAISTCGCR